MADLGMIHIVQCDFCKRLHNIEDKKDYLFLLGKNYSMGTNNDANRYVLCNDTGCARKFIEFKKGDI